MSEIILHNYPESPVAEKVRIALGIKGLEWLSVKIPRIPPKPLLMPLTGGYRRTPVMQIGADIYCDSQCILAELERRFPTPSFFPLAESQLVWSLSRWTDGVLFDLVVQLVLGTSASQLPADWAKDRGRLYLGKDWAEKIKTAHLALPHLTSQMRATLADLNAVLGDGRAFLAGASPTLFDAQIYHLTWFLRGRWADGPAFLSEFTQLEKWEARVAGIGHGNMTPLSAEEALEIAANATPEAIEQPPTPDPQGLEPGLDVAVSPDVDGGEEPVTGTLVALQSNQVTLQRSETALGKINVHFPRVGYRVVGAE